MTSISGLNTFLYAAYIVATVCGVLFPNLATAFFALKIVLCVFLYVVNCRKIKKSQNILLLITIALIIFSGVWNGDEIKSVLLPCHFILMMVMARFVETKFVLKKIILFFCGMLFTYFAFLSVTVWNDYLGGEALINPNSLAKYLVVLSIIIMAGIRDLKHNIIWRIGFGALSFYFVFMTFCRSAIGAYAFYLAVTSMPILERLAFKYARAIAIAIIAIGSVFPMAYVNMYKNGILSGDSEYFGKDMYTGRQNLWPKLFSQISDNPIGLITGYGTKVELGGKEIGNYHSWYFGVPFSFGIIIAVLYFAEYVKSITKISNKGIMIGCISLMIIGVTEMLTLWEITQSLMIILFMYAFLTKPKEEK